MYREIKFRAWNTDDNKMEYPLVLAICNDGGTLNFKPLIKCADGNSAYKDYPLMQFTGLHDRNGKEIYEGDILQYTDNFNRPITGVVQYLGNGFWIEEKDETHYMPNDREVIGNIYENPELIGGTQKEEK